MTRLWRSISLGIIASFLAISSASSQASDIQDFLDARDRFVFGVLVFIAIFLIFIWQIVRGVMRNRSKQATDWRAEETEKRSNTDST
jgi:uncharacterized membrane protein